MAKLNFQPHYFSLTESHDPSEIILICWFAAQETCLIIINVESFFLLLNIFVETVKWI